MWKNANVQEAVSSFIRREKLLQHDRDKNQTASLPPTHSDVNLSFTHVPKECPFFSSLSLSSIWQFGNS